MKTVVDQALGDVVDRYTHFGKRPGVQNALMRHPALVAHEQHRVRPG